MTGTLGVLRFGLEARARIALQRPDHAGRWMRDSLVRMGPAFVKLGQFVSTRGDVVPKELSAELAALQDAVLATPFEALEGPLSAALDRPWTEVFDSIDPVPLKSASVGQVHAASYKGRKVVVKLQKPGVSEAIRADLATLARVVQAVSVLLPDRGRELESVLEQYAQFLTAELDFAKEADNMARFRAATRGLDVIVPRPVRSLCTSTVLVMEYVPSEKIGTGSDPRVAERIVEVFVRSIADRGAVHCDPHPGNVGVSEDGRIVLYDFGNVLFLDAAFRESLRGIVSAIARKDVAAFVGLLVQMGILKTGSRTEAEAFFATFFEYLETMDANAMRDGMAGLALPADVRLTDDFSGVLRMFSLLDGTLARIDPDFNYVDALGPYVLEFGLLDLEFLDARARRDLGAWFGAPSRPMRLEDPTPGLQRRIEDLERGLVVVVVLAILLSRQ
jgi:ubiquinone biosynthesis protein